jgi:hypothetical protein
MRYGVVVPLAAATSELAARCARQSVGRKVLTVENEPKYADSQSALMRTCRTHPALSSSGRIVLCNSSPSPLPTVFSGWNGHGAAVFATTGACLAVRRLPFLAQTSPLGLLGQG